MPLKNEKKNGHGHPAFSQAVSEALFQDAPVESAAVDVSIIDTHQASDEEFAGLIGVPFLGPSRRRALAEYGILTVSDLHAASLEQVAGIKGIGAGNAERIKEWLSTQTPVTPGLPPPPPEIDPSLTASPDPILALDNDTIFSGLGEIDMLISKLRGGTDGAAISKKLGRQFDKIASVTSELAEGPDTLSAKQLQQSVKLLKRIVTVLQKASANKRLSEKKQDALAEELRDQRKAIQKTLGD